MAEHLQEIFKKKIVPVTFERSIGLFGATTIGVGALMGAGVYVLIGLAAEQAGPSVWLSYTVCGALAFLTTLMFAEFARRIPKAGGGYVYAYDVLGSVGGFITGWFLALGSVFACGLYAIGFAKYSISVLGYDVHAFGVKLIAIGAVLVSMLINSRGTKGADKIQNFLTWGNLAILAVLIFASLFHLDFRNATPMFPRGLAGTGSAISIIYISFFGYQLIANNADEIIEPAKTVPKAMMLAMGISFTFYLLIAVVAVLVVPWQELAASNAPLVVVASKSFGSAGWLLISFGGILASAGALNSTLLSKGRQIYAMGNHHFLPRILGRIHEAKKTPQAALYAGGLLIMLMLLVFDLGFIAKSANFCLLASLLPISLALRKLYRDYPEHRPASFFRRRLPEAALIANVGLLFTLDWLSLMFGVQLAGIGAVVYFVYSRKREIRTRDGMNIVLAEPEKKPLLRLSTGTRILVPMANPKTQQAIFSVSDAMLAHQEGGEIIVLSVVNAPEQVSFYAALSNADYALEIIERSAALAKLTKVPVKPIIRASRSIPRGIVHAAEEENCNLIVMGYAGTNPTKSASLMEEVLHHTHTDTIFIKLKRLDDYFAPKRIAVSLGGRFNLNLQLMVQLAGNLADYFGGEITFLNILPTDFTPDQKAQTDKAFIEALQQDHSRALYNIQVLASDEPLETLVEKSTEFDLLIVGTTKVAMLEQAVVGSFATQIAERSHCSVAIVRVVPTPEKIIKKI